MSEPQRSRAGRDIELVIVIATAGRADLLQRSLEFVAASTKPAGYVETVVVENGERRGAQQIVDSFRRDLSARYLYSAPANKSAALNLAIDTLADPLIIFTDDDIRCDSDLLLHYSMAAADVDVPAFFGGPTGVDYEQRPPEWLIPFLPESARGWEAEANREDLEFLGFNWAAYASHIRAAGGFDEDRGPGGRSGATGQETAMQKALRQARIASVYVPEARVWHYVPTERSTPEWVLNRRYRSGIEMGLDAAQGAHSRFALSLWVTSRIVRTSARSAIVLFDRRPERHFDAAAKRQYNRGLLAGVRYSNSAGRP